MERYFVCKDNRVVKMGDILIIGGVCKSSILTGDYRYNMVTIGEYESRGKAEEIFNDLTDIILHPTEESKREGEQWIIM